MISQKVLINPRYSIRFAGRWGTVVDIDESDLLPLRVQFDDLPLPYRFDYNEVVTEEVIKDYFNNPIYCPKCKQDVSKNYNYLVVMIYGMCEDCLEG